MNLKRTLTLGAVCAVFAALLASAATSGRGHLTPAPLPTTTEVDVSGAALAAEIARLHDRLHPTTMPQQPARNVFEFNKAQAPRAPAGEPMEVRETPPPAPLPQAPLLKLLGIAEDSAVDGAVRTAIISGYGELFLAKEGDAVTFRYRVRSIAGDGVELEDVNEGTTLRLDLK